jgi:TM2 domain-containing membrane protein YozV
MTNQQYQQPPYPHSAPVSPKNRIVALILAILFGGLGVHRFYVGKVGTGILMLITIGGFGIWWIVDIIMIAVGSFTDKAGFFVKRT